MGFGNPYGDPYEIDYVGQFVEKLDEMEVGIISLADTIGISEPELIRSLFTKIIPKFPHIEFGAHLHSHPAKSVEKINAVYESGCRRLDGALMGYGGCPMAKDDLVGNIATEVIKNTLQDKIKPEWDEESLKHSMRIAREIFLNNEQV